MPYSLVLPFILNNVYVYLLLPFCLARRCLYRKSICNLFWVYYKLWCHYRCFIAYIHEYGIGKCQSTYWYAMIAQRLIQSSNSICDNETQNSESQNRFVITFIHVTVTHIEYYSSIYKDFWICLDSHIIWLGGFSQKQ